MGVKVRHLPRFTKQVLGANGITITDSGGTLTVDGLGLASVYQPLDGDLTAIAALSGTGIPYKTGANAWSLGANVSHLANTTASRFFGTDSSGVSGVLTAAQAATLLNQAKTPQDFGAIGNGVANDTTALQAWIDDAESSGYGRSPSGKTYATTGDLTIGADNVTLDFGGSTLKPQSASAINGLFAGVATSHGTGTLAAATTVAENDTDLPLVSAANFAAGRYVVIVYTQAATGYVFCHFSPIESISVNTVKLSKPVPFQFATADTYTITCVTPRKNITIRNLVVDGTNAALATSWGINFEYAVDCLFEDIQFSNWTLGGGILLNFGCDHTERRLTFDNCGNASFGDLHLYGNADTHIEDIKSNLASGFGPEIVTSNGVAINGLSQSGAVSRGFKLQSVINFKIDNIASHNSGSTGLAFDQGCRNGVVSNFVVKGNKFGTPGNEIGVWLSNANNTNIKFVNGDVSGSDDYEVHVGATDTNCTFESVKVGDITKILNSGGALFFNLNSYGMFEKNDAATVGPVFTLMRESASPANGDLLGEFNFKGRDSGAGEQVYGSITATIDAVTAGAEYGLWRFSSVIAGTLTISMFVGNGVAIGSGAVLQGVGTLNVQTSIFVNGTNINAIYQPLDADLTAYAGLATTGVVRRTGAGTADTVAFATQADQETATSTTNPITPSVQHYHPGHPKVWAAFNSAGTVAASYNTTSVTDNGTGDWTVNIGTDFSSANYSALAMAGQGDGAGRIIGLNGTPAAGTCRLVSYIHGTGASDPASPDQIKFSASGDQ